MKKNSFQVHQDTVASDTSLLLQKSRLFVDEDVVQDHKSLFPPAMYAHLCHSEGESPDDERSGNKRLLQYYAQPHQFHAINHRASSPIPSKTPFTLTTPLFPPQQIYNGHHIHEGK